MSTSRRLLRGPKFNQRHSAVIKAAEIVIRAASADESVSKISVSKISPTKGGKGGHCRIKFKPTTSGFEITVRGNGAVQQLYVFTNDPPGTKDRIEKTWARAVT